VFREEYRAKYRATAAVKGFRAKVKATALAERNRVFGKFGHVIDFLPVNFPEKVIGNGCVSKRPAAKACTNCRIDCKRTKVMMKRCEPYRWQPGTKLRPKMEVWKEWTKTETYENALNDFFKVAAGEKNFRMNGDKGASSSSSPRS
jgi:hypothetical protein